ncbi:MAG TPA: RsmD family RNA methyltransferase [Candidatus Xenobia bacterium]
MSNGPLRPTAAKVREALLEILKTRLPGCSFLDLYAGVGAVGLEAWEAGAARVVLVEKSSVALRVLRENVRSTGATAEVVPKDVVSALRGLAGQNFDIVFLDPPYGMREIPRALEHVEPVLAPEGIVVAEHHHKDPVPESVARLKRTRVQKYGETLLSFYS